MPNTHDTSAASRRGLLRGLCAALAGGAFAPTLASAAAVSPDAELLALCAEFDTWERRDQALSGAHSPGSLEAAAEDALNERFRAEKHALLDRICDLPCATAAGINALGNTLALFVGEAELEDGFKGGVDDRLLAALLRGITGKGVVRAAAAADNPDADLLALCAEFHRHHADALSLSDTDDYTWEDAQAARWEVSDEIEDMRPATGEGHRAKAAVALMLLEEQRGDSGDADVQFVLASLRDMLGRA